MQQIVSNPHNHVPEVSSDDLWGDAEDMPLCARRPATILPPRRPPPEDSQPVTSARPAEGLRIESSPQRRQVDEFTMELDVHTIDGSVIRLDPTPAQTRVPRVEVKPEPILKKSPVAEGRDWGTTKNISSRWIIGISLGVCSLVILALMLLPLINRSNAVEHRPGQTELALDTSDATDATAEAALIERLLNLEAEAGVLFKKSKTAGAIDDLATIVRDPRNIIPLIRGSSRGVLVSKRWNPNEDAKWNVLQAEKKTFGLLSGSNPDFSRFNAYFVMEADQLRLDWKATTGYGTATFDELANHLGNPAEIRGTIIPADFYTPAFPEADYQSYQLHSPDNMNSVWAYMHRESPSAGKLARIFTGGNILASSATSAQKVTLRLKNGPEGTLPGQWVIEELLHEEWITP